jgi:hypothetical protein
MAARVAVQLCLGELYFHDDMAVAVGWAELRSNLGPLADIHPNRVADGMVRLAELRRRQGQLDEAARPLEAAGGHYLAPLVCAR